MQGADTVLFSLCHGNNTKPNCPPFCLSSCIYFVFLFLFFLRHVLSGFLGYVQVPPSIIHHSWNQLYYPASLFNSYRGKDRKIWIYSLRQPHHTFSYPIHEIPLERFSFFDLFGLPFSNFSLCTFSFLP